MSMGARNTSEGRTKCATMTQDAAHFMLVKAHNMLHSSVFRFENFDKAVTFLVFVDLLDRLHRWIGFLHAGLQSVMSTIGMLGIK